MDYFLSEDQRANLPQALIGNPNASYVNSDVSAFDQFRALFYLYTPGEVDEMGKTPVAFLPPFVTKAIPFFILLCVVEMLINVVRKQPVNYRVNDAIMSFSLGTVQQLIKFWFHWIQVVAHAYIWTNYRILDSTPQGTLAHVTLLCIIDVTYYWFHRLAHEWHIVWAAHSVHHSGEDYNLATALRQGALQSVWSMPLGLISAFFFPTSVVVLHETFNLLYQFWIHTTAIGSLGPLEYVLNTASHHRMHHRPPGNCNYAGVLIIWDRMFGTFKAEDRQQDYYGLAKQYESFNPVWANIEHFRRMIHNIRSSNVDGKGRFFEFIQLPFKRRVRHKMVFHPFALFKPLAPERHTATSLWEAPLPAKRRKLESSEWSTRLVVRVYCIALFLLSVLALVVLGEQAPMFTVGPSQLDFYQVCVSHLIILSALASVGAMATSFRSGVPLETCRLLSAILWVYTFRRDLRPVLGIHMEWWVHIVGLNLVAFIIVLPVAALAFSKGIVVADHSKGMEEKQKSE